MTTGSIWKHADVALVTLATFKLMMAGTTTPVGTMVSYDPSTRKAMLNPNNDLRAATKSFRQ
jgi:hypothetical protein